MRQLYEHILNNVKNLFELPSTVLESIKRYDLHVRYDLAETSTEMRPTAFISTEHDPSVGMFGLQMSPVFHSKIDLMEWWNRYGQEMGDAWIDADSQADIDTVVDKYGKLK